MRRGGDRQDREVTHAIGFRRLGVEDLQQVFLWLARPHVSKWYAPAPSSFMEVVAKYGPRVDEGNAVQAFIVEVDATDVGYIQTYAIDDFPDYARRLDCGEGVAGVDLFIGEEAFMHRGVGAEVVRRFVDDVVFARDGVHACLAGPTEGDRASILAFEKAGFRRWKTVKTEGGESECVLRRERGA
jgi:RimJ/RimL family protein N-acetyltransferase